MVALLYPATNALTARIKDGGCRCFPASAPPSRTPRRPALESKRLRRAATTDSSRNVLRYVDKWMRNVSFVAVAAVLALAVPATAAAPPEVVKLRREVAALKLKVKRLTAERNTARRQVAALRAQLTPKPIGSVTLRNGENGDHARVTGAGVTAAGDILGQISGARGALRAEAVVSVDCL